MNKFGIDSNQRWSDAHSFVEAIEQAGYYSKCLAESTSETSALRLLRCKKSASH